MSKSISQDVGFGRGEKTILVLLMAAALLIRISFQTGRAFAGDSLGTILWLRHDYTFILTHFKNWLTMNVFICIEKFIAQLFGENPWALIMPSLICGIALVPVTAVLTRRVFPSERIPLIAAALVALNPYLISHSVQLRSYLPWTLCLLVALIFLHDWYERPSWRTGLGCVLALAAATLLHANTIYFAPFWALVLLGWVIAQGRSHHPPKMIIRDLATILGPGLPAMIAVLLVYAPLLRQLRAAHSFLATTPPTPVDYLPHILGEYFGEGFLVLPALFYLVVGVSSAARHQRKAMALPAFVVIPILGASFSGLSHFPWAYARFLIPVLPVLLIAIAGGIDNLSGRKSGLAWAISGLAVVALSWWPTFAEYQEYKVRYPWNSVVERFESIPGHKSILPITYAREHPALQLRPYLADIDAELIDVKGLMTRQPPSRVYVLCADSPIQTARPSETFGEIQCVTYDGDTARDIADPLLADLVRSTDGRIDPRLTGQYNTIRQLQERIEPADRNTCEYDELYYECLMRTKRQRYMPPQFMDARAKRRR